jgi:protein-disulfide isomerase
MTMMSKARTFAAASAALLLITATAARAEDPTDTKRTEVERIIKEYLIENPEVIEEALQVLEKRKAEARAQKQRLVIKDRYAELFTSKHQVTLGNHDGDVTLVEFFDYNCGYCKRALGDLLDMMKADPKLRVVLKEFPILGPGSVEAAKVAVAVRMQDPTGVKYLEFHRKMLESRGPADKAHALAAAKEVGLDIARIERDLSSDEVTKTIEESMALAKELGIRGTPSYVVGSTVMVGAVGLRTLKEKVQIARQ